MKLTAILTFTFLSLLCCLFDVAVAQNPAASKGTATISGRITVGEQPLPGVEVVLTPTGQSQMMAMPGGQTPAISATTDFDGRYKLASIAAGQYQITAHAPAYVLSGESLSPSYLGKTMNITESETIENVDFSLIRGGVITGKVTNTEGRPVIAEMVFYFKVDQSGKLLNQDRDGGYSQWDTDDRGVYRIFGVEAGRYKVCAGSSAEAGMMRGGMGSGRNLRTFHPDVTDESKAKVIEVTSGGEAEGVDITITRAEKGFSASGRVIDAETGKPISGMSIGYQIVKNESGGMALGNGSTNSRGEFRLEGLTLNTYSIIALNFQNGEMYSDPVKFEIAGGDVSGLEIKMLRGASISGVAVLEGVKDPAVLANLSKIDIGARVMSNDPTTNMGMGGRGSIGPDGSFRLTGVRPGKNHIYAGTFRVKGLTHLRTEYNGAEVTQIEVNPGDQLTGVRMVFVYGSGVIAGRVEVKGGSLPPGAQMYVNLAREGEGQRQVAGGPVDNRGQFLIEGIAQGNYKLTLRAWTPGSNQPTKIPKVEQMISVAGSGRQDVSVVLDLSKKDEQ